MDIPDILKLTSELLLLREDRKCMAYEDDRSSLCRSLETAQKKIDRLTKCLKASSDDYDILMKRVLNSAGANGVAKKRPIDDVNSNVNKSVRIADKHCPSPVKAASPVKVQHVNNNIASSLKKQKVESEISNSGLFSSPTTIIPDIYNEEASPESIDLLNVGRKPITRPIVASPTKPSGKDNVHSKSDTNGSVFPHPLTVVSKKKESMPSSSSSSSSVASNVKDSNQLVMKAKVKVNSENTIHRASTIDTTSSSKKVISSSKNGEYQTLDLVESKSKVAKISRSSSLVTTSYSKITSNSDDINSTKSRNSSAVSHNKNSDNYKCIDVVRKRSERDALPGHTCFECEAFYTAMIQQGIMSEEGKKEHLRQCSRHKAKYTPPTTPEGFWDLTIHTPEEWK